MENNHTINKILEEYTKEFWDDLIKDEEFVIYRFQEGVSFERVKSFLISSLITVLQGQVEGIEKSKKEMKESHICRFNDGDCDCNCYLEALSEVKSKLLSDIATLQELMK